MAPPRLAGALAPLLLGLGLAAGCALIHPPVPVYGTQADLAVLAGEWAGTYESPDTGRSGSLSFTLTAEADSAFGEVMMRADRAGEQVVVPPYREGPRSTRGPRTELLTIRFVRVDGGQVAGTLDPYLDPACQCPIQTTFQGIAEGDDIRGTFVSYRMSGEPAGRGAWRAERVRE